MAVATTFEDETIASSEEHDSRHRAAPSWSAECSRWTIVASMQTYLATMAIV